MWDAGALSDREDFRQALAKDRILVSSFLVSRTSGRKNMVLSRAVHGADGGPSGVLIGTIDLSWLRQFAGKIVAIEGGSMLLLDRTGTVLMRHPDDNNWVGRGLSRSPVITDLLRLHDETWDRLGTDGVARIGAVATIAGSGEKLIVAFDKAAVLADANAELSRNLWRLAVLVLGAALVVWLGGELFFMRWVRRLKAAADKLGRGEFNLASGVPRVGGEFAVVGRALKTAGARLAM